MIAAKDALELTNKSKESDPKIKEALELIESGIIDRSYHGFRSLDYSLLINRNGREIIRDALIKNGYDIDMHYTGLYHDTSDTIVLFKINW